MQWACRYHPELCGVLQAGFPCRKTTCAEGITKPLLQTTSHGNEAQRDLLWSSQVTQLVLLLWALQDWESPGHCAGCSGGHQVCSGHTWFCFHASSDTSPSSAVLELSCLGFHNPKKKRNKFLTHGALQRGFPTFCPPWWMLTS